MSWLSCMPYNLHHFKNHIVNISWWHDDTREFPNGNVETFFMFQWNSYESWRNSGCKEIQLCSLAHQSVSLFICFLDTSSHKKYESSWYCNSNRWIFLCDIVIFNTRCVRSWDMIVFLVDRLKHQMPNNFENKQEFPMSCSFLRTMKAIKTASESTLSFPHENLKYSTSRL